MREVYLLSKKGVWTIQNSPQWYKTRFEVCKSLKHWVLIWKLEDLYTMRFGSVLFGSVNVTKTLVFSYSVFTHFIRPLEESATIPKWSIYLSICFGMIMVVYIKGSALPQKRQTQKTNAFVKMRIWIGQWPLGLLRLLLLMQGKAQAHFFLLKKL